GQGQHRSACRRIRQREERHGAAPRCHRCCRADWHAGNRGTARETFNSQPAERAILLQTIAALGKFKRNEAVAAIAPFARNDDSEVRQAAAAVLTRIGGDPATAVFLSLLNDSSADIRRGAVTALGELKARSALPLLLKAYRDHETKWEAIAALARVPDAWALDAYLDG